MRVRIDYDRSKLTDREAQIVRALVSGEIRLRKALFNMQVSLRGKAPDEQEELSAIVAACSCLAECFPDLDFKVVEESP